MGNFVFNKFNPPPPPPLFHALSLNPVSVDSFCRGSRDLAFPDKILQEARGEKWQLKNLWIFLKQTIT